MLLFFLRVVVVIVVVTKAESLVVFVEHVVMDCGCDDDTATTPERSTSASPPTTATTSAGAGAGAGIGAGAAGVDDDLIARSPPSAQRHRGPSTLPVLEVSHLQAFDALRNPVWILTCEPNRTRYVWANKETQRVHEQTLEEMVRENERALVCWPVLLTS